MPGSDHWGAYAGLWKRPVASKTARAAAGGIGDRELAARDAVGDDAGDLLRQRVDVCGDDLACLRGERDVGREQLGVLERRSPLGADEEVEPAAQALRCGAVLVGDRRERLRDAGEPALGDGVAQRRLAGEVPVDAAVADAERAGDVDDRGLGRTVAAQDVLRRVEDAVGRQGFRAHAAGALAPLAVEDRHLAGVVAVAGGGAGRHCALDPREVVGGQLEVERAERLGEPVAAARADQRHDVLAAREHPGDRDLGDRRALLCGDRAQRLDEREVAIEVLAGEAGGVAAEVVAAPGRGPPTSGR